LPTLGFRADAQGSELLMLMRETMKRFQALSVALFVALPALAWAQDPDPAGTMDAAGLTEAQQPRHPKTSVLGPIEDQVVWGSQRGSKWIAASNFTVRLTSTAPVLTYAGNFFFNSPGTVGTQRYYAQIDVEPGSLADLITCVYNDGSATNNVTFTWYKYTTNVSTGASSAQTLATFTSAGSAGIDFEFLDPASDQTISTLELPFTLFNHYIAADVASDTSITGCWVFYKRQVAPAPSTATFPNDVPTTSPIFRFVEALATTGVTGGCGAGSFCPDQPVTRGQMAVFLAVALGMGFPH
jgi:hypothetical protein